METLFIFLVKAAGLIGMFYLAYILLLRKETFFNSNRWFLLAGLISSVVLPLVVFTKKVWVEPSPTTFDWSNIPMTTTTVENEGFEINWYLVFGIVYSIGIVGFLVKFVLDFYSLSQVLKDKTIQHQADFQFIDVNENIAPFSYFNSIVYNSSLYSATELENILEHEKVHSAQNHTVDVLISRLFCIVFWFNPLMWLYKKAIVQNLEFIADNEASKNISDKKAYQLTLLKITTQENCVAITNHFYQSLIKKRIVMLNKNQSNKRNSWKYAVVLPLLGAFLFFFQVKVVAQEKVTVKQETETKEAVDLTTFKIEKDLIPLSKGKEIYVDGEKINEEKLAKINLNDIKSIDVIKKSDKSVIVVTTQNATNQLTKTVKITDKDIYIDGVKSTDEEFSKLDKNNIDKVDVNTNENTVRITTKTITEKNTNTNKLPDVVFLDGKKMNSLELENYVFRDVKDSKIVKGEKYDTYYITTNQKNSGVTKTEKSIIIVDGEKVTQNDLDNLDPKIIQTMDVNKESGKSTIKIRTKKGFNIPDETEIFVNGKKISKEEMEKLDSSTIESIDVTKNGISQNSIKIITRKIESNNLEQAKREAEEAKRYAEQTKRIAEEAKREAELAKRVAEQAKIDAEKAKKRK